MGVRHNGSLPAVLDSCYFVTVNLELSLLPLRDAPQNIENQGQDVGAFQVKYTAEEAMLMG